MSSNSNRHADFAARLAESASLLDLAFAGDGKISRRALNSAMEAAFGCAAATGVWSQRDSFQMLEMATLRWLSLAPMPLSADAALALLRIAALDKDHGEEAAETLSQLTWGRPLLLTAYGADAVSRRELVELVISLLRVSPFERPLSAADVLRHPFFAQA